MKFYFHTGYKPFARIPKLLLVMKLTILLLITAFLQVSQATLAQRVSYKGTNVAIENVFEVIQNQTQYKILYAEEMVSTVGNITVNFKNASVEEVLNTCFKDKPLAYTISNDIIVIKARSEVSEKKEQQPVTITGKVTDSKGEPLAGVNIALKGTTTGTTTDVNGNYHLTLPDGKATLVFTFVGFLTQEVTVKDGATSINIKMSEEPQGLNEVTVVGYGTQKKTSLTAAVSAVKGSELAQAPVENITDALAGRVSGITARPNGGSPGQDNPDIYVRGVGTTGNSAALIVVDGVIRNNISQIDPNDIDNVSILKDAAAVAPYGLGGANGVILITTKHGKTGAPKLTLNTYYGFQRPTYPQHMLDAQDYMTLKNEADVNSGLQPEFAQTLIDNYNSLHAQNSDQYPNSNAETELMHLNQPLQNYNVQLSGGTDRIQYYVGLNFFRQDGIYSPLYYNRYNYNAMLDIKATNTTTITIALNNAVEKNQTAPDPVAISYIPTAAIYYSNGAPGQSGGASPGGDLASGSYARTNRNTALNTLSVEQQLPFVKGLSIKAQFAYDPTYQTDKDWTRPSYYDTYTASTKTFTQLFEGDGSTTLYQDFFKTENFTYQGYINYHNTFGKNELTGLVVAEARNGIASNFSAQRKGFNVDIDELNLGTSDKDNFDNGGSASTSSQVGYVYRLDYAYAGKYMLEATGRYDGHYYFAPDKRYAYFPAFSAGWRMSEEKFIKDNAPWIDNLKLRGSWGMSGNLAGGPYQYLSNYSLQGNEYAFGTGSLVQGSYQGQESNPNITWEKSTKTDVGFDASFWKSLLTVEADYFYEKRTDMLLQPSVTVPLEYGIPLAQENAGIMSNHGFEVTLGTNHKFDNGLSLNASGNFSFARNKLLQVFETDATRDNPNRSRTGREYGTPFGYEAIGLFKTSDDKNGDGVIDAKDGYNITQFGTLHPGDVKYADLNHDGKIDDNDEIADGYPTVPEITYGLNLNAAYKGFDLTLFFEGAAHSSLNIQGYQTVPFRINNTNTSYEYFDNMWTPQNQNAKYPVAYASKNTNNTTNPINGDGFGPFSSSLWMASTSFVRLKTASLGYTIPSKITKRIGISALRVYATGQNMFTLSPLKFEDPETGYTSREESYPVEKAFIFGISATF